MTPWTPQQTQQFFDSLDVHIAFSVQAHQKFPIKPKAELRYWDMKTPYAIHPLWCAMTILTETSLAEEIRIPGAWALLCHDVLEDTTQSLPDDTPVRVVELVKAMTFESIDQEMKEIWKASDEVILLKLYDKTSNLLDSVWMKGEVREKYREYTQMLLSRVNAVYSDLHITNITKDLIKV